MSINNPSVNVQVHVNIEITWTAIVDFIDNFDYSLVPAKRYSLSICLFFLFAVVELSLLFFWVSLWKLLLIFLAK